MIRGRTIVCIASSWFDHPTSKQHVMRRLAAHNDVLWVNYHASRRPQFSRADLGVILRRLRQTRRGAQQPDAGVTVVSPLLAPLPESTLVRRLNAALVCRAVRRALRGRPERPLQIWSFTPDVPELLAALPAERVVYYCVDDFAAFSGFNTALIERLEARTLAVADVVIATSRQLFAERSPRHPRVHHVPHGVDFEHFAAAAALAPTDIPADLRAIPGPRLGYLGVVADYMDFDLLAAAARARPHWSFVLVGDVRCDVGAIARLPNIHLLGGRPYAALPQYCRGFDLGLIPFRMNRLTRAVNPIKLREYLAADLPVVSAPMDAVRTYAPPAVHLAETLAEFLPACEAALASADGRPSGALPELVRGDGWAARVELLARLVMELPPTGAALSTAAAAAPPECSVAPGISQSCGV